MAQYRARPVTFAELPLMCIAFPVFQAKYACIEATEHYQSDQRDVIERELDFLEKMHNDFMEKSITMEEDLKEKIAEGERIHGMQAEKGSIEEKESVLENLRTILER